ncbi:MAG: DUF4912 domain-containing protein [Candidatus Riflebacteria bacterium]|nr:DUF4912 domain-containing protein [Candidatus Riflebacteria bacterium]
MKTKFSGKDLEKFSREKLFELAQSLGVAVRKNSTREKLIEALLPLAQNTEKKAAEVNKTEMPEPPVKRGRGRPPRNTVVNQEPGEKDESVSKAQAKAIAKEKTPAPKIGKKTAASAEKLENSEKPAKSKRGRPPRSAVISADPAEKPAKVVSTDKSAAKVAAKKEKAAKEEKKPIKAVKAPKAAKIETVEKAARSDKKTSAPEKPVKTEKKSLSAEKRPAKIDKKPVAEEFSEKPMKRGRGRPPKAVAKIVEPAAGDVEAPVRKGRGRPPKAVANSDAIVEKVKEKSLDASACATSDAAVKSLSRGFAKKSDDAPSAKNKKGAEVMRDGVAIPVEMVGGNRQKTSSKAEQIEKDRSRRHSSLKTTMDIPVFQPSAGLEATSPISEDELTGDLPVEYGETRVVLQIRDPHWAYAYWEIPRVELKRLELEVGIFEFAHSHFVLRLHNVSQGFSQEIKLSEHARNWYIYLESPQTVYQVELGMHSPAEGYSFIALSNLVQTPPDRVSDRWAAPVLPEAVLESEERVGGHEISDSKPVEAPGIDRITAPELVYFSSLSGEVIPLPGSSDLLAGQKLLRPEVPSSVDVPFVPGGISSFEMPGSFAMPDSLAMQMPTSPAPSSADWSSLTVSSFGKRDKDAGDNDIFLTTAVEVIVYGKVKVGCELTFQGDPLRVRPDGSFSLRLALPFDSGHSIDLVATDMRTGKTRVIKAAVNLKKH